jgi:hypothetical protein
MRVLVFALLSISGFARADVAVEVLFKPLPAEVQPLEAVIRSHITLAVEEWTRHFQTVPGTITVLFSIKSWPARGTGRSFVSTAMGARHDGKHISEEGAAHKIRTGRDTNGSDPDIEMFFDPAYFRTLWFDPDPKTRQAIVPSRKLDAYSVILHELGHAFGFNGFRDPKTGAVPGEFMSIYDRWVEVDGDNFYFHGPEAMKLHGGPVLLAHTRANYHHFAEPGVGADAALQTDLMNGITLEWGRRYFISALDIAILTDCGQNPRK